MPLTVFQFICQQPIGLDYINIYICMPMIGGFPQGGKNFIKRKDKRKTPRADNFVFRLHYQFTFGILVSVTMFSWRCLCCFVSRDGKTREQEQRERCLHNNFPFSAKSHSAWCHDNNFNFNAIFPFSVGGDDACGWAKLHWFFWLSYPVHAG